MSEEQIRKRNTFLLELGAALMWFSMYAYVPILPAYAASLGADAAVIGIIGGVYGILQIVLRVGLGIWSDRLGRDRLLLLGGFSLMVVSALMFLLTNSITWIIIARTTAGAAAAWWVIVCAAFAKYQTNDTQVKGQGVIAAAANIGKVIAAVSCAFAAQFLGYKATFTVALAAASAGVICMFMLKSPARRIQVTVPLRDQLKVLASRDLILFSVLALISQMVSFAVPTTFTPVVAENLGADSMQLGLMQVVYFAVTALTSLVVVTKFYRRIGGIAMLALSFAVGAVSCVPDFYASLPAIYLMNVLSGFCYGVTLAVLAGFVLQAVPTAQRGSATGIFQSLYAVGIFAGPVAAGAVIEAVSYEAAYWIFAGACLLCTVLSALLIPKRYAALL